jgi:hypothetical protein
MYIRTAHLVAPGLNEEEIVFNVTHEHFIVLLMCPPKPFKNQAINLSEFA